MCFLGGIKIWLKYKGKFVIVFQPFPHVIVCAKHGVYHFTNKSGSWKEEKIEDESFCRWLLYKEKK